MRPQRGRSAAKRSSVHTFDPAGLDDPQRLAAVHRLLPLFHAPSTKFDRITRMAADLLACPLSLLTLISADRQYFVSSHGLPEPLRSDRQTSLEYSICQHVVRSDQPLIVEDVSDEPKLEGHPAVADLGIGAYAGSPVSTPDGQRVGTTCVLDVAPHRWSTESLGLLGDLAALAGDELRLIELERQVEFEQRWRGIPHP